MRKKGQLTIFVLLGIVVLIAVALLLQTRTAVTEAPAKVSLPTQFRPVQQALQDCINYRLEIMLRFAGVQGGYLVLPDAVDRMSIGNVSVPFWYVPGKTTIASRQEVERQLSDRLGQEAARCARETTSPGFTITLEGTPTAKVRIADDKVVATVQLPVSVDAAGTRATIDQVSVQQNVQMGNSLDEADLVARKLEQDKDKIDLTLLLSLSSNSTIYNYTRLEKVLVLTNPAPKTITGRFDFAFGIRLAEIQENLPPVFKKADLIVVLQGDTTKAQIKAHDPEGGPLRYDIISKHFTIDSSGVMTVTGELPGRYHPIVRVEDDHGLADYMTVQVIVI